MLVLEKYLSSIQSLIQYVNPVINALTVDTAVDDCCPFLRMTFFVRKGSPIMT